MPPRETWWLAAFEGGTEKRLCLGCPGARMNLLGIPLFFFFAIGPLELDFQREVMSFIPSPHRDKQSFRLTAELKLGRTLHGGRYSS